MLLYSRVAALARSKRAAYAETHLVDAETEGTLGCGLDSIKAHHIQNAVFITNYGSQRA